MFSRHSTFDFQVWLESTIQRYTQLSDEEKNQMIDHIIFSSDAPQLRHLCSQTEILLHRDFVKLLPPELREYLLSFIDGKSLLMCCCVSRTWNEIITASTRTWLQACKRSGIAVQNDIDSCDGSVNWKSFFIDTTKRFSQMKAGQAFVSKTLDKNLRRVTAVYYNNGKLATASDSKTIQLWDCQTDQCLMNLRTDASVSCIKFDDQFLVASSYLGHIVAWDILTGQRLVEYMRHGGAVFSFDFSKKLNVVISGSADKQIKIWALTTGRLCKTLSDHSRWVLKILLEAYSADGNTEQHLLFSMDQTAVIVRLIQISSTVKPESIYLTTLYGIPIGRPADGCFFTPGLHFDGANLYFIKGFAGLPTYATFCQWNLKERKLITKNLKQKVKALLGVGKKYVAILRPWQANTIPNFIVIDRETLENVAIWYLPPSRQSTPDCAQLSFGEKSWLDGLDGKNDNGILFSLGTEDNSIYVVKWTKRNS